MIRAQNISKSTKRVGKYEEKIIEILIKYFQLHDYKVVPHSSLNIAWGSIISDIDLLLIKNNEITYVEVKSSRDSLSRAKNQIDRIMDYVDYAYVATDKIVKKWDIPDAGLISVQGDSVTFSKLAKKISSKPRFYSVACLKKKCLVRFIGNNYNRLMLTNKYELAQNVYDKKECTRDCLKEIVTCGGHCDFDCPVLKMIQRLVG